MASVSIEVICNVVLNGVEPIFEGTELRGVQLEPIDHGIVVKNRYRRRQNRTAAHDEVRRLSVQDRRTTSATPIR